MLQNAYFNNLLAKIGADTAENEHSPVARRLSEGGGWGADGRKRGVVLQKRQEVVRVGL